MGELLKQGKCYLEKQGITNSALDAEVLLRYVSGMSRSSLFSNLGNIVTKEQIDIYINLIRKRSQHIPLQYLTGIQEFMSLEFQVNEHVLIPRPETEQLVERVTEYIKTDRQPIIVDLGTGSGAIAVSIAKNTSEAFVYAVDLSADALQVAQQNGLNHGVEKQICFLQGNLFQPLLEYDLEGKVHAVVSNPPYIPEKEISVLAPEVREEPFMALNGGEDGLQFYRNIIQEAPRFLISGGMLGLEIGYNQGKEVKELFVQMGAYRDVTIIKDYAGLDRIVLGIREKRK